MDSFNSIRHLVSFGSSFNFGGSALRFWTRIDRFLSSSSAPNHFVVNLSGACATNTARRFANTAFVPVWYCCIGNAYCITVICFANATVHPRCDGLPADNLPAGPRTRNCKLLSGLAAVQLGKTHQPHLECIQFSHICFGNFVVCFRRNSFNGFFHTDSAFRPGSSCFIFTDRDEIHNRI